MLQSANLAIRFLLELTVLAAVTVLAVRSIQPVVLRSAAAAAAPLAVATVWATVVHGPGVPSWLRATAQIVVFGAAALSIVRLGRPRFALGFAVVAAANAALMALLAQ
ncbi:MAG: DUF2568 domain-containing protein [Intrasporangium sp.]|uniref:DUF2568 domain-containing protein n=1 Tax=Intrasporangium sp. TaxID=1925024 RepID=UPI003F7FD450